MPLPTWDGTTLAGSKQDNLGINDVINAGGHTELEAETYILQAVEKITVSVRDRADMDVSALYSSIVEDELNGSAVESSFETEIEETGYEDDTPRSRPTLSVKQCSQSTLVSNSKYKPLIQKELIESDTVEGTLFGLTSALTTLDNDMVHKRPSTEEDAEVPKTKFTSADKLAKAAHRMLDEKKPDDDASDAQAHHDVSQSSDGDSRKSKHKSGNRVVKGASKGVKEEWEVFNTFFTTRKDTMKAYTRKVMWLILIPSFALAFFLFYVVENPDLCPIPKKNGTVAPTMAPSFVPSAAPTELPSAAPSHLPSEAPSDYDPWLISWSSTNETSFSAFTFMNASNVTFAPTNFTNETLPPNVTEAPAEESIFDALGEAFRVCPGAGASASWWVLFMGVRQVLTLTMALITQSLIIDYLALSSRVMLNIVGPFFTLLIVQSKGWPFILIFWAFYDLILLCGDTEYAHHWGYWQDWFGLFNEDNPSGNVVNNEWNRRILVNAIIIGVAVAVKRLVVGLVLGRQTFAHYGEELAKVMKNMVLIGEVATLARQIESNQEDYQSIQAQSVTNNRWNSQTIKSLVSQEDDESDATEEPVVSSATDAAAAFVASRQGAGKPADTKGNDVQTVVSVDTLATANQEFTDSQQFEIAELVDAWEEPQTAEEKEEKKITIGAVLQFRQALTFMKKKYPFLPAFGAADTREACIESSQQVYDRLLLRTPYLSVLPFETLALSARKPDGAIDKEKAKEIIRAFRPDRDGTLGKLEWVKSVDVIYRDMRLLSANICNSSEMDAAVENLVNVVFYIALGAFIMYNLGENPVNMFLSFSSVILAFSFMIGKSASRYFDGCLFILVQRPYGVGDRMHLSNPQNETSPAGSSGWIVEKVSLFTTSVYWGTTNERATLCNGAISNLRVINAARSPNATVFVELKFSIDTEYEKIEIFRTAAEQYLKDRPREWLTFVGFRPTEVAPDKGYIGYKVIAQHRNSWQAIGSIIESKANLTTYALEVAKQLEMRYASPPLPVDLSMKYTDGLVMPVLGEVNASPQSVQSAASPFNTTGLRHRRGKSRFAELVQKALTSKDKGI